MAVRAALAAGCRLLDTAASYKNEADIGAVLREEASLRAATAIPRDRLFITSKLRPQARRLRSSPTRGCAPVG